MCGNFGIYRLKCGSCKNKGAAILATSQLQYQHLDHMLGKLTKMGVSVKFNKPEKVLWHPKYLGQ